MNGFKWFSSATDADITLLLARPRDAEGHAPEGSKGLSLFFARVRKDDGKLNGVRIHRLKNKMGTKALPTAELELQGMRARMVRETPVRRRLGRGCDEDWGRGGGRRRLGAGAAGRKQGKGVQRAPRTAQGAKNPPNECLDPPP